MAQNNSSIKIWIVKQKFTYQYLQKTRYSYKRATHTLLKTIRIKFLRGAGAERK